ncbi:MAG: phage terminase large subunit, partial [Clostridia bacterium]|nr:phage terminase large subunit [Clostridia bacterium]
MANEQNLRPCEYKLSQEEAKKGGINSGIARRKKATMLQTLAQCLEATDKKEGKTYRELTTLGLIKGAVNGNGKNYEIIQQLMEKQEAKEEAFDIITNIPAKDIASTFSDINRSIDDREYREYYLEGGRGSTKSSFISEKIIELLENNPRMCAVVLRKVKDTLKDSVFAQLEWAIDVLGETYPHIKDNWKLTKSPLEITNTKTGQKIYFRGADDYGKIKSLKTPANMYVGITWYEEFDQFAGMNEVRKINQSLIRGGDDFIQFYSYNTPASSQHFVNIEKMILKDTRLVHLSDYRSVPKKWLGQAFIDEAEFLKSINEKLYDNEYLGLMTGVGGNVFENVELREITDDEINTFDFIYQGLDFGYFP